MGRRCFLARFPARFPACFLAATLVLASCGNSPSADQVRASRLSVSESSASIPVHHTYVETTIEADGSGSYVSVDGYPPQGSLPPSPLRLRVSPECRERLVQAIVAARLGSFGDAPPPVGGATITVSAIGPSLSLRATAGQSDNDRWERLQRVAQAAACAR